MNHLAIATLSGEVNSEPWLARFYLRCETDDVALTDTHLQAIAQALAVPSVTPPQDDLISMMKPLASAVVNFTQVEVIAPYFPDAFFTLTLAGQTGTLLGEALPSFVAAGFRGGRLPPGWRRFYKRLPLGSEGSTAAGQWVAGAFFTGCQALATAFGQTWTTEFSSPPLTFHMGSVKRQRIEDASGVHYELFPTESEQMVNWRDASQVAFLSKVTTQNTRKG